MPIVTITGYDERGHLLAKDERGFECRVDPWVGCAETILDEQGKPLDDEMCFLYENKELVNQIVRDNAVKFIGKTFELTDYHIYNPLYLPSEGGWKEVEKKVDKTPKSFMSQFIEAV